MMTLTDRQVSLLTRAQEATFGQLRQQYLTEAERQDCTTLATMRLMKDVVGTTFMLTDSGRRR